MCLVKLIKGHDHERQWSKHPMAHSKIKTNSFYLMITLKALEAEIDFILYLLFTKRLF